MIERVLIAILATAALAGCVGGASSESYFDIEGGTKAPRTGCYASAPTTSIFEAGAARVTVDLTSTHARRNPLVVVVVPAGSKVRMPDRSVLLSVERRNPVRVSLRSAGPVADDGVLREENVRSGSPAVYLLSMDPAPDFGEWGSIEIPRFSVNGTWVASVQSSYRRRSHVAVKPFNC